MSNASWPAARRPRTGRVPAPRPRLREGAGRHGRLWPRVVSAQVARADGAALARGRDGPGLLARHPLAQAARRSGPRSWHGEKYIGFDKDLVIRREVDRFLREQASAWRWSWSSTTSRTSRRPSKSRAGVALLPEPTLRREVAGRHAGRPAAATACRLVRPLGIIHRRHHKLQRHSPALHRPALRQRATARSTCRRRRGRPRTANTWLAARTPSSAAAVERHGGPCHSRTGE